MKEIKIIEIPIYSIKINKFEYITNQMEELYNNIIGYLLITATVEKVSLTEYKVMNGKISNMHANGLHDYIEKDDKNNNIINKIINLLNIFENNFTDENTYIEKNFYIDLIKNLNIKKMIDKIVQKMS